MLSRRLIPSLILSNYLRCPFTALSWIIKLYIPEKRTQEEIGEQGEKRIKAMDQLNKVGQMGLNRGDALDMIYPQNQHAPDPPPFQSISTSTSRIIIKAKILFT